MIKVGIFIVIGIALFIARKNIANGVFGFAFVALLLFGTVFLIDSYSYFPIRNYIGLGTFDKVKHNPKEELTGVGEGLVDSGKNVVDKIGNVGDDLDEYYDTGLDKEPEPSTDDDEVDKPKEEKPKKEKKPSKKEQPLDKDVSLEGNQYSYKNIDVDLKNDLYHLTDKEKSIIRGLSPLISLEFETDNHLFQSVKGEQFYIVLPK